MSKKKLRKLFLILVFPILLLMLVSCDNNTQPGNLIESDLLKSEFDLESEEVVFIVSVGLSPGYERRFNETPPHAFKVAVTRNTSVGFATNIDDMVILKEITEYEDGRYNYSKAANGVITFNHSENIAIPSEFFSEASGDFYFGLFSSHIADDLSERVGGSMNCKYSYKIENGKISLSLSQFN